MTGADGVNFCTIRVDDSKCKRCLECINNCPTDALQYYRACFLHNAYECNYEKECEQACPENAITILEM